jgi:hypothetical protein
MLDAKRFQMLLTAIPVARPWYRLHFSTWLLFVLLAVCVAAAEVFLVRVGFGRSETLLPNPEGGYSVAWFFYSELDYGWPLPYLHLKRALPIWGPSDLNEDYRARLLGPGLGPIPWESAEKCPGEFMPLSLGIDAACALLVVGGIGMLWEWRRRCRRVIQRRGGS